MSLPNEGLARKCLEACSSNLEPLDLLQPLRESHSGFVTTMVNLITRLRQRVETAQRNMNLLTTIQPRKVGP